uniref:Uncharacterized protein n=1 Tax=Cyanoderma ruficeps TaxID=181631 RepID=A0A8C3QV34_9PASS
AAWLARLPINAGLPLIADGSLCPGLPAVSFQAGHAWLPIARGARQARETADPRLSLRSHGALYPRHPRDTRDTDPIDPGGSPRPHRAGLPGDTRPARGTHVALVPGRARQPGEARLPNAGGPRRPRRAGRAPVPPGPR